MKRIGLPLTKLFAAACMLFIFSTATAQQPDPASFEGSFKYLIKVSGKDAESFLASEPCQRMDMHIKEDNFIVHLYEGSMPKTFLYIGDSNHTYIVDARNERVFLQDKYRDTSSFMPKAVPTGDSAMVHGVMCYAYGVKKPGEVAIYYVSDKYKVNPSHFEGQDEAKADFLIEGLEGRIPLKKVIKTPTLTFEVTVQKIQPMEIDDANFVIPAHFAIKKRDNRL